MRWGPDGRLWVTERSGKRVVRVNPADGSRTVALTIADAVQRHAQDGVLGLALHPDLLKNRGADFVYVVLTHDVDPGEAEARRLTIRRYTYDPRTETLGSPTVILDNLPAGEDHLSGRLVFGLDQTLYLTVGDQGYNQLSLYCTPIRSQELPTADDVRARKFREVRGQGPAYRSRRIHSGRQPHARRRAQPRVLVRPSKRAGPDPGARRQALRVRARSEHGRRAEPDSGGAELRVALRGGLPGRPRLRLRQLVALGARALFDAEVQRHRCAAGRAAAEGKRVDALPTSCRR